MPHPEREHELQIALATALRERDEARAMAEKWIMREAACAERGIRADADALSEIQGLQEALAAARRECEGLRKALRNIVGVWKEIHDDAKHRRMWILGWDTWLGVIAAGAALAAPADGEESMP